MFDLSLVEAHRFRPFELVSPGFVADDLEVPPADLGSAEAVGDAGLTLSEHAPAAPFAAVVGKVAEGAAGVVELGLAGSSGDAVLARHDRASGALRIVVRCGATVHHVAARRVDTTEVAELAFVLCENQVTVLGRGAGAWRALLTDRDGVGEVVDLRVPDTLTSFRYAWGGPLRAVRSGLFGMAGVRDPHLVQHADGTPYVRDGKAYLTASCAGLGFFRQAHWGVFTLDLADPTELVPVGKLFTRRDGLLLGDHAGQVVRDDAGERWLVATSSWGDFEVDPAGRSVHVRHLTTTDDVLHGVHVLETEPTPLPTEHGAWDPGMTLVDGRWHVSFVESPSQEPFDFHPALAVAAAGGVWTDGLELVGSATGLHQCEGPVIAEVEGRRWLLASDGDDRHYPVFDLAMRRVGRLDAPYPTNIPHPTLVPLPEGGHLMVTFDGTPFHDEVLGYGGHGDVVVMRSR